MNLPWRDAELDTRLQVIGELLQNNAALWRPQAFTYLQMPWEARRPELARQLRALPLAQAELLAADDAQLADFLRELISDSAAVARETNVPAFPALHDLSDIAAARDVPGRKWRQLVEFAAVLPDSATPTLEWCAGKAHLGRLLARTQHCAVTALEWNAELIADGEQLARREQLPLQFHRVDVMSAEAFTHLQREQRVVALHACGDLHTQLLRGCAQSTPNELALAPCCYHLIQDSIYRPLSQSAARADLHLSRDDLRTAVQGSVTSPLRVQNQRKQLQAWRLGFDLLQRELRAVDVYLPTPSLAASVLHEGFAAFCRRLALHHQLDLPAALDYSRYERAGAERLRTVTALDLPRLLFRRALEVWLLLDRALFLREAGYSVTVGTFCERRRTPRNLLISARYCGPLAPCSQ